MIKSPILRALQILDNPSTLVATVVPVACVVAIGLVLADFFQRRPAPRSSLRPAAVISAIGYVVFVCHYPFRPIFYDHVEPTVFETVRQMLFGMPAYNAPGTMPSLQYGPYCFAIPAVVAGVAGLSVTSIKIVSAGLSLASLGLVLGTIRRVAPSRDAASIGVIYFCAAAILFRENLVWIRGDSQLLFFASLAMWAAMRRNTVCAFALVGVAAGACLNVKIHGFLYAAPALALIAQQGRLREWSAFVVSFTIVAVAPFLLGSVFPIENYLYWLRNAAAHGVGAPELMDVAIVGGFVLLPVFLASLRWLSEFSGTERRALLRAHGPGFVLVFAAVILIAMISSKQGAGYHHWMPIVPAGAFAMALSWRERAVTLETERSANRRDVRFALGWSLVPFALVALLGEISALVQIPRQIRYGHSLDGARNEVRSLAAGLSGESVAMGYGGDKSYIETFFRTELPDGNRSFADPAALMDLQQAGMPLPRSTLDGLRAGTVRRFLIPRGDDPFTMRNFYDQQDLFGPELREIFRDRYRKTGSGAAFDVWTFND